MKLKRYAGIVALVIWLLPMVSNSSAEQNKDKDHSNSETILVRNVTLITDPAELESA